jgi:hypothetical protein
VSVIIAPLVTLGQPLSSGCNNTSPILIRQIFAAAARIRASLDYLSTLHEATALGATHLHLAIFSLDGLWYAKGG